MVKPFLQFFKGLLICQEKKDVVQYGKRRYTIKENEG